MKQIKLRNKGSNNTLSLPSLPAGGQGRLSGKINKFPKTSGVYFMKNAAGKIIYVGKANNLHSRLRSYFHSVFDIKTQSMMQEVKNIIYRKTASDLDAFLLEARLIRELKPKYNIQLTDDKTFPLLAITHEKFPRVFITRERGRKNITYYGPFISGSDLRNAFRTLQRIFRFRTCKYKPRYSPRSCTEGLGSSVVTGNTKSCLLVHINLCLAPCLNKIGQTSYQEIITSLEDFLKGNKVSLNKRLVRLMKEASKRLDYESAAFYRDQLKALDNISEVGKLGPFYEESLLTKTPQEKLRHLTESLGLASDPVHIEGIDISDIKGNQAVGSVVVFIDGEPAKNLYRRFKIIQTPEGMADDYSRIREIVRRRFGRLAQTDTKVDLLLIDGGKGHINATSGVLSSLGITAPVIVGLVKTGKMGTVYLMKQGVISRLRMNNKLRLLSYASDEAHRFAQKYHHLRRSKEALQ